MEAFYLDESSFFFIFVKRRSARTARFHTCNLCLFWIRPNCLIPAFPCAYNNAISGRFDINDVQQMQRQRISKELSVVLLSERQSIVELETQAVKTITRTFVNVDVNRILSRRKMSEENAHA